MSKPQIDVNRVGTLIAERFALLTDVSPDVLHGVQIEQLEQYLADSIAVRISTDVYGEKLQPETAAATRSVPATWWQHYRFAHRSAWWLRWHVKRWPIRTSQITLTATWDNWVMYPWAQLRFPVEERRFGRPVRQTRPPVIRVEMPPSLGLYDV